MRRIRHRRKKLRVTSIIGELLIFAGLATLGYIVWQPWHTGTTVVEKQTKLAAKDSARWDAEAKQQQTKNQHKTTLSETPHQESEPLQAQHPQPAEVFAVLYVPSFGTNYANRVAETTDWWTVLNLDEKGIGHYENTQMPGEPGNFVLAGHRSGPLINSFRQIMNLRVGDPLFVETAAGWYTYRFRDIEYVLPEEVDVLLPFPRVSGTPGEDQILTLTTCHPKLAGSDERAIAYSVLEHFQPRADGPPKELLKLNPTMTRNQAKRGDQ